MSSGGLFELTSARHLLEKAEHDLARLRANPMDGYAAFDLFVTARHIPEWLYPDDNSKSQALFKQHVELRICRHIADGAKHFVATDKRHHQVLRTAKKDSAWGGAWGSSWGASWGERALVIDLDPTDADTVVLGAQISATDLGEKVVVVLKKVVV